MLLINFYTNLTIKGKSLHLSLGLQLLKSTDYIPNPNDIDLIQWTQSYLLVQWLYENKSMSIEPKIVWEDNYPTLLFQQLKWWEIPDFFIVL